VILTRDIFSHLVDECSKTANLKVLYAGTAMETDPFWKSGGVKKVRVPKNPTFKNICAGLKSEEWGAKKNGKEQKRREKPRKKTGTTGPSRNSCNPCGKGTPEANGTTFGGYFKT